jgi:dihydrofolate reductase
MTWSGARPAWRSRVPNTAGLAAAAIELGLVDDLRMVRNPVVVDGGTPFLPPVTEDIALNLIETRTFGSRARRVRSPVS